MMKNPIGFGVAILATASLAFAGGDDDKKGKGGEKSPKSEPTPLLQSWSGAAGKGLTYSSDMFSLNLRNGVQVALNYNNNDTTADTLNFNARRARTHLSGHIWNKDVTYHLSNEWTETTSAKDVSVGWVFHRTSSYNLGVELGQMKTRFGNEWNSRYDELEFVDRGLATRTFSGARSRGAMLHGDLSSANLGWSITGHNTDIAAAASNSGEEGDPRPGVNDNSDNKLNWNFEAHWSSNANAPKMGGAQGDLAAGGAFGILAGAAYNIGNAISAGGADVDVTSINVFVRADTGTGLSFAGEYFMREESPTGGTDTDHSGFQVSGSWVAPASGGGNRWGAGIRYAMLEIDDAAASPLVTSAPVGVEMTEIEFVVNMFYHEHAMKTQLGVTLQNIDNTASGGADLDNVLVALQTTVTF
jgi:hypothetical protein